MRYTDMLAARREQTKAAGRALAEKAKIEKRDFTADEQAQWEQITADLATQNEAIANLNRRSQSNAQSEAALRDLADKAIDNRSIHKRAGRTVDDELNVRFRAAARNRDMTPIEVMPTTDEIRSGHQPGIEQRALTSSGLVGTTFFSTIQRHLVANSAILAAGATMMNSSNGQTLKVPKSTAYSAATITPEGTVIPTSDPVLGSATLNAWKYAFLTSVTHELIEDESFDVAAFLAEQAGIALANGAGADFINGNGTSKPRGLLLDTTLGVTGGTGVGGAFTSDNLIDLYHSVAAPYARSKSAAWLVSNASLSAIRKLKDSQNRYLFSLDAPLNSGADGTLFNRPVFVDPNVPNVGLGAKSVIFGDISRYWVRSINGIRFEQSYDFAFSSDIVTFRGIWRADGALVDTTGAVKHFLGAAS